MNRYFRLICTHEDPKWYIEEFRAGRVRFGWSDPGCDLREMHKKDWVTWSDDQRVTWSYSKFLVERVVPGDRVVVQTGSQSSGSSSQRSFLPATTTLRAI